MSNSQLIHLFPGGNTSNGFYSFYKYILSQEEANRIFCIKGGPGTGKSTMMKKIGNYFFQKGFNVEFHHCSSDNESLDAVVIKELKVALLDGTSPHIVDPINPGAVDEVLNLGDAINMDAISKYKKEIIYTNTEIGKHFRRAYRFLSAAKAINDDWSILNSEFLNNKKLSTLTDTLINKILSSSGNSDSINSRHLFATAFTPNGVISYIDNITNSYNTKFVLTNGPGLGKNSLLQNVASSAEKKGFYIEYFHNPLTPDKLEHILIPELSTCILTENEINNLKFDGIHYNMLDLCDQSSYKTKKSEIDFLKTQFTTLSQKALDLIHTAHILHDDLESYYVNNIDFKVLDNIYEDVIKKIEKYI